MYSCVVNQIKKFKKNISVIQKYVGNKKLMPVIRANAYGTYINKNLEILNEKLYERLLILLFGGKACCHLEDEVKWQWVYKYYEEVKEKYMKNIKDVANQLKPFFLANGFFRKGNNFIKIENFLGDGNIAVGVVKLLLDKLLAEDLAKSLSRNGLAGLGVEQGSRLFYHIGTYVVPIARHFALFQINLVGDLSLCHNVLLSLSYKS